MKQIGNFWTIKFWKTPASIRRVFIFRIVFLDYFHYQFTITKCCTILPIASWRIVDLCLFQGVQYKYIIEICSPIKPWAKREITTDQISFVDGKDVFQRNKRTKKNSVLQRLESIKILLKMKEREENREKWSENVMINDEGKFHSNVHERKKYGISRKWRTEVVERVNGKMEWRKIFYKICQELEMKMKYIKSRNEY